MQFFVVVIVNACVIAYMKSQGYKQGYADGSMAGGIDGITEGMKIQRELVIKPSKKQAKLAAAGIDYAELDAYRRLYGPLS